MRAASASLTLASGALMMLAGYVGYTESWAAGVLITIPGGIVILAAHSAAVRADQIEDDGAGFVGGGLIVAAVLLSGAVMFLAGCAIAIWSWTAALALATAGGLIVSTAFALNRRHRSTR